MGKYADGALAILVLIIGIYVFTKLGLNIHEIFHMFDQFFFGSGSKTAGMIGLSVSRAKMRKKIQKRKTDLKRERSISVLTRLFSRKEANNEQS